MLNALSIFAGLDQTGAIRFVGDVPRGAACGCICSACGAPLVAKRGEQKKWHFAHEASQERPDCFSGAVNLLRRLAIEALQENPKLELPLFRRSVVTKPPLPIFLEVIECDPGKSEVLSWEVKSSRNQPVALLRLASGTRVRLFVEVGYANTGRLPEVDGVEGGVLFSVPLPLDATVLNDQPSAKNFIVEAGIYEWQHLPDADPLIAETLQRLEQSATSRANVKEEISALRRIGGKSRLPAEVTRPPSQRQNEDLSPWSAWRKPRSSFIFYGLTDGSAWLLMQHLDGRSILVPWPRAEEGWDEQLPARLGSPDLTLGGLVLASDVNTMIYLRGQAKAVRTSSDWVDILEAAGPFR
mgnify:CR=1 FL=1